MVGAVRGHAHGVAVVEAHGARAEANALLAAALLASALVTAALTTGCAASSPLTALGTVVVAAAAIISSEKLPLHPCRKAQRLLRLRLILAQRLQPHARMLIRSRRKRHDVGHQALVRVRVRVRDRGKGRGRVGGVLPGRPPPPPPSPWP